MVEQHHVDAVRTLLRKDEQANFRGGKIKMLGGCYEVSMPIWIGNVDGAFITLYGDLRPAMEFLDTHYESATIRAERRRKNGSAS